MMIVRPPVDFKKLSIRHLGDATCFSGFESGEREIDSKIMKCCEYHNIFRRRVFCAFYDQEELCCAFYCISILTSTTSSIKHILSLVHQSRNYIPFVYLHQIGVKKDMQNRGIGTALMMHAIARAAFAANNIGVFGMALNALNDRSAGFYDNLGFKAYDEKARFPFMVLPAQTLVKLDR